MLDLPDEWCGLWIADDGKCVLIERVSDQLLVTVTKHVRAAAYRRPDLVRPRARALRMPASWSRDKDGTEYLEIEAGTPGLGPTYRLRFVPAGDGTNEHGNTLTDGHAGDIEVLPSVSMGLYDDFDDDLGVPWAFPLLRLRRATPVEREEFDRYRGAEGFLRRLLR